MPKVSICLPTYNQTIYLKNTLDSILNQSFDDYELIITDDSTTDEVENFIAKYDFKGKLKYFKNTISLGSSANWNYAMNIAQGEYIKFIHHDDYFVNNESLKKYIDILDENQNFDFAFSSSLIYNTINEKKYEYSIKETEINLIKFTPIKLIFNNWIGSPSAVIFRNDKKYFFDENLKWLVDIDFFISILIKNNSFGFIKESLVCTTINDIRISVECIDNKEIEISEHLYLYNKYRERIKGNKDFHIFYDNLFFKHKIYSLKEINEIANFKYNYEVFNLKRVLIIYFINLSIFIYLLKNFKKYKINFMHIKNKFKELFLSKKNRILAYRKNSFSQSGEDMIIRYLFDHINVVKPTYIDIGANYPFELNNTATFYLSGSKGICIEPNPELYNDLCFHRYKDLNLNIGVGNEEKISDFYILSDNKLCTFNKNSAEEYCKIAKLQINKIKQIKIEPLSKIIEKYNNGIFPDLLCVDSEGFEENIIYSINFEKKFPKIICVETASFSKTGKCDKNVNLINYIIDKGYILYADTNINSIFIKKEMWIK